MHVVFLDSSKLPERSDVGGKSLVLSKLFKTGLNIPLGFTITTETFNEFLIANNLEHFITKTLSNCKSVADTESASILIVDKILAAEVPHEQAKEIMEAYIKLQDNDDALVAVRSSGIDEDSAESSFAGLHDTFLQIDDSSLLESVKKCWASLFSKRALDYRLERNKFDTSPKIAVLIQKMVQANTSGVLFTVNPIDSNPEEVVINSSSGLGEAIVSGEINADQILAAKKTGKITEYKVGETYGSEGTQSDNTPLVKQDVTKMEEKTLSETEVRELVEAGKKIEDLLKKPQDIEWAIDQGELFILQARPITTLDDQDEEYLIADNVQEAFPNVLSPYTGEFIETFFIQTYLHMGFKIRDPFFQVVDGYLYFNISTYVKIMREYMPMIGNPIVYAEQFVGARSLSDKIELDLSLKILKKVKLKPTLISSYNMTKIHFVHKKVILKFEKYLSKFEPEVIKNYSLQQASEALVKLRNALMTSDLAILWMTGHGGATLYYMQLVQLIEALPNKIGISPSDFLKATDKLSDARLKKDISALAKLARDDEGFFNKIVHENPQEVLKTIETSNDNDFAKKFILFLETYGHLSDSLGEIMEPHWIEKPETIIHILRSHLIGGSSDEVGDENGSKEKIRAYFKSGGISKLRKLQLKFLIDNVKRYSAYRENLRFTAFKGNPIMRNILLRMGELLKEKKYFEEINDIFFLIPDEMKMIIDGEKSNVEVKALIRKRRSEFEKNKLEKPARKVFISGDKVRKEYHVIDQEANVIKGFAASGGIVKGKARVLTDLSQAASLKKGEILVARVTNPAWTSLFSLASAVVVDIGSALSHGALIARELGLPCVMGTQLGTEVITTGQEIIVDGGKGIVEII